MNRYSLAPTFADRYALGRALGRGGMAEVFEAAAHGAQGFVRRVAIKRLIQDLGDDAHVVRMFLDEARIASQLHHSGIVSVLDYGVAGGAPFQVLELVEGWDVGKLLRAARLRGRDIPVDIALMLATEVAHALAYAHERTDPSGRPLGIVHRDVKPSNILVARSGGVKLGDFGIALARERSAITTGFAARGTPGYMSPEQLLGGVIGPASDIFAVGITLHGLLSRTNLLGAEGPVRLLSGREIEVSQDIPLDARAIIQRAVRLAPEERYATAREMAQELGEALAPRLETDPRTRMTEWLTEIQAPPARSVTPVARQKPSLSSVQRAVDITQPLPRRRPPSARKRHGRVFAAAALVPLAVAAVVLVLALASGRVASGAPRAGSHARAAAAVQPGSIDR